MVLSSVFGLLICAVFTAGNELLLVHTVWNHGTSTPLKPIPSDPKNMAKTWREGLGETTQRGRAEAFKLGRALRQRYLVDNHLLLNGRPLSQELYIRSSDHNRSISSAYATLAGLLSETTNATHWTSLPVHSRPLDLDDLLNSDLKCPFAEQRIEEKITGSTIFKDTQNIGFLQHLVRQAGYGSLRNMKTVYYLWEALKSVKNAGRQWPKWITKEKYRNLENLINAAINIAYSDQKVARLKGGPLLNDMLSRIQKKIQCATQEDLSEDCFWLNNLRFYAYSADDMTLQGLLASLGAVQGKLPSEAAAITVELWRNSENKTEIRVLYRAEAESKFRHILIGGCRDLACDLADFSKRSQPFIPSDWEEECGMVSLHFGGIKEQCESEQDQSSEQNCRDWAEFNYCREDAAVRYLYCRKTCLCNPKFSKQKLRRTS